MKILFVIIQYILFYYFAFFGLLNLFFVIVSKIKGTPKKTFNIADKRIAVLIPGYKEDNVIIETTESALNQHYPTDKFIICVIADHFLPETIIRLKSLPVLLIEPNFKISTKAKAINAAFDKLKASDFDIVLVLDADNLMNINYLQKMNNAFCEGYVAVQGHRIAKALNSKIAILDAISEEINNTLYRKGLNAIGLSSAIIGSGMAFEFSYFKSLMSTVSAIGGFDKEIELKALRDGKYIHYLEDAYIYDEKVSQLNVFYNQRRRWLSSQFHYFNKFFFDSIIHLICKRNIDYFIKALQMAQPPRLFLLAITIIMSFISFFSYFDMLHYQWVILFFIVIFTLLFATPLHFYNKKTFQALLLLPKTFIIMFYSFLTIRGANRSFIHTPHTAQLTNEIINKN